MTSNEVLQENTSSHLTPNYDGPQQPPGAEVEATFTFPRHAKHYLQDSLPQGHMNIEDTSRIFTGRQFPVSFQGNERTSLPGTLLFSSWGYGAEA